MDNLSVVIISFPNFTRFLESIEPQQGKVSQQRNRTGQSNNASLPPTMPRHDMGPTTPGFDNGIISQQKRYTAGIDPSITGQTSSTSDYSGTDHIPGSRSRNLGVTEGSRNSVAKSISSDGKQFNYGTSLPGLVQPQTLQSSKQQRSGSGIPQPLPLHNSYGGHRSPQQNKDSSPGKTKMAGSSRTEQDKVNSLLNRRHI